MLQVIGFLLNTIIDFIRMLFTIDIGSGMSLGLIMCLAFIFLPMMLRIINFIKQDALEELDDMHDSGIPIFQSRYQGQHTAEATARHSRTYFRNKEGFNRRYKR